MSKNCWWSITILFLLFIPESIAASNLTLRFVDEATLQPIVGCTILVDGKGAGFCDAAGVFNVTSQLRNSLISVRHMAYIEKVIDLNTLPNEVVTVPLRVNDYGIGEVVVAARRKKIKLLRAGVTSKHYVSDHYSGYSISSKIGTYIPNKRNRDSLLLQAVNIFVAERGVPSAPFLMSIYKGEQPFLKPNIANRLYGPILCQADRGNDYLRVNVAASKIVFPQGGVFIILEAPENKRVVYQPLKLGNLNIREDVSSARVGHAWQETNKFYMWFYDVKGWRRDTIYWDKTDKRVAYQNGNLMIYVDLKRVK